MNGTIDVRSFGVLVMFFMVGTSILIAPSGLSIDAQQDSWIACAVGVGVDVLLIYLLVALGERYPGKTMVQICELALGRWFGTAAAACYVLFCYMLAILMIGDMGIFVTTQIMPETPIEIIKIAFSAAIVFVVRNGLKSYAYTAEIFFPWIILLFLLLILPSAPKVDWRNIKPILEYGIGPVWKGAYHFFSLQELVVLMMIYPYVTSDKKSRRRAFLLGVLAGGAVIELTTLSSSLVLGHSITSNQLFPAYVLAKHISIGQFLERLEAMMMFIWILTIFIKTTITFHSSAIGLSQLLRLGDEKPYLAPLAMNMIVLSLLCYPNVPYVRKMLAECWTPFAFLFMVLLPVILLGAAAIRQRTSTTNANAS